MSIVKLETNSKFDVNSDLLEKVILENDLKGLTSKDKVLWVTNICSTIGLNPITKPIQLIKFDGQEKAYFTKDATEQLRKINNVSINRLDTKIEGNIYIVTSYAILPNGRTDSATGVVYIEGLSGKLLTNAMMKAETKAKRRVTLSICGLGFMDESEADSIAGAQKIDIYQEKEKPKLIEEDLSHLDRDLEMYLEKINSARSEDELRIAFDLVRSSGYKKRPELLKILISAKDERKKFYEELREDLEIEGILNEETKL